VGLAASEMSKPQVLILRALIDEYAHNLPSDVAEERLSAVEKEGYGGIKFSWSGGDKAGVGHDYRIQGATFLIEFNNTQPDSAGNLANHVHSVWHDLAGNFALEVARP
jgi:nitrogenase subunit NifH